MFIRNKKVKDKKTGKEYIYSRLVESYSKDGSIRQRTVLYLGKLDLPKEKIKILAKLLENRILGNLEFDFHSDLSDLVEKFYQKYQDNLAIEERKEEKISSSLYRDVDIKTVTSTGHRTVGAEFVLNSFWERLKLDKIFSEIEFSNKEKAIAKALILGRIISPGSELHTYNWFQNNSALNEFHGYDLSKVGKDSFYCVGDFLYNFKDKIEKRLRDNLKKEYSLQDTLYLYDLTNTYFESSKPTSKIAKRGKSKEKRSDCPLVTLALVVDQHGFPVYSKIYEGNKSEPQTFSDMITKVFDENDLGGLFNPKISIAMDRGIATADNISYLKANNLSYFVVERRETVKDFEEEFSQKSDFKEHETYRKEKVYLKKIENETSTQVLVYSVGKEKKEQSIVAKKEQHFLDDIEKLITSNSNGNIVKPDKINQRIGKLQQKYGSIASAYEIKQVVDEKDIFRVKSISYSILPKKIPAKKKFAGCYVIETDHKNYSEKEIWDFYMKLNQVESAFQAMKSDLGTRPVYHKKDERIKSHLFISVLAYSIMHSVIYALKDKGHYTSWSTLKKVLSTHQRSSIIMETSKMKKLTVRVSSKPEESHKKIYDLLNLNFKENRIIEEEVLHL